MRLSIFSRLIIGYMAVFFTVISVSVYTVFQLRQFNDVTHSITDINNRVIEYGKELSDSFLSQIRHERKYMIMRDTALYDRFLSAERDFNQYLNEVTSLGDAPDRRDLLMKIKEYHNRYKALFSEEIELVRANKSYPESWYTHEKEKAVDGIMEGLKNLKLYTEQDSSEKIKRLGEAGIEAHRVAIAMIAASLLLGIAISVYITWSITNPLAVMKKKTREIAMGNFDKNLEISSPPEIEELAQAFNLMCDKLKEMDKMKSDFFSLMAHELRTPLTSIKEGTNLLLEGIGGEVTDKQKKLLRIVTEESNRLIELVNSLLDFSKMKAGMMSFNFTDSDIRPLMDKAVGEIEPLAAAKNVSLRVDISQELPIIKIDSERILQVLRNLIGNAIKFTPSGGCVVISPQPIDGGLKVSVTDTGPGMPKEILTTIFDRFKQATIINYNKVEGTGLGLAIVKHIIEAHGGDVWAESELGYGSTFVFILPV
ncbi:MAG: ATP-binding protein [Syntrophales bacterium]|nr:ATP-binding protein [Syntrophales bacterium]